MAALMAIGIAASLIAVEPLRITVDAGIPRRLRRSGARRGFFDAVIGPFTEFFRVYGWLALLMLAMISFYQLPEFVMGPMANPFYHDLGLSKDAVGAVRASVGLVATLDRHRRRRLQRAAFRLRPTLIVGVVLKILVIANFATLAVSRPRPARLLRGHVRRTISASASPASRW